MARVPRPALRRVSAIAGEQSRPVFWACAEGEVALHQHLRTLNMARIPGWAASGESAPRADGSGENYETVMFRHWDASVLGALLPVLDAGQFARMLGPAQEIALFASDYGGLKRVLPDPGWPSALAGMLTVRSEQLAVLIERRIAASHRRAAAFLHRWAPEQVSHLGESELRDAVARYDREVSSYEARDEVSLFLWSFIRMTSPIDFARETFVRDFLKDPRNGATPRRGIVRLPNGAPQAAVRLMAGYAKAGELLYKGVMAGGAALGEWWYGPNGPAGYPSTPTQPPPPLPAEQSDDAKKDAQAKGQSGSAASAAQCCPPDEPDDKEKKKREPSPSYSSGIGVRCVLG